MSPEAAKAIFYILSVVSIPCTIFPLWASISLFRDIADGLPLIPFDTAFFYLILMSVFWPMAAIELIGSRPKGSRSTGQQWLLDHAGITITVWFMSSIVIATVTSYATPHIASKAGYYQCSNPDSVSRKGRGESLIFSLARCETLNQP